MSAKILIVDDEKNIRRSVRLILKSEGYQITEAENADRFFEQIGLFQPDIVLLDIVLPRQSGIDMLKQLNQMNNPAAVIMMSGHGTVQNVMQATRLGAFDFIEKPISKERLLIAVQRAMETQSLRRENLKLRTVMQQQYQMIGTSPAMNAIREQIARVAPTNGRVLITGESGTGKELVARAIHENSDRQKQPFVKVNCAAIPEELIEAELFGSEKGAYTGSVARTDGKFLLAHQGTLFLDEIGDMSLKVQAKVLRALQEGEFERVGGQETIKVDVRVITATNKNLETEVEQGRFREDLFYRLNVVPIHVKPLRQRKEDIPELIDRFIQQYCERNDFKLKQIDASVIKALQDYDWPGNVRELQNVCERLVILSTGDRIVKSDLPGNIVRPQNIFSPSYRGFETLKDFRDQAERDYILWCLEQEDWNISKTAQRLGIERTNLHKKINRLGLKKNIALNVKPQLLVVNRKRL